MNEAIITRNNELVSPDDTLIICGDLMLGGSENLEKGIEMLNCMNGKKLIVGGNHDTRARREAYLKENIPVFDAYAFTYRKYHFYASHYPTLTGNLEQESLKQVTCNLFGHTHQTTNFYNEIPFIYHVGVDSHNCYPVHLDTVIEDMKQQAEAQRATAEAIRIQGEAEAAAAKARGEAEAAAIQAKAEAEAEGLMKKAEAMKQYGEAAKMEALKMYFQQLPAIAEATGQAYTNVDKIVMFGDNTSKLSGDIINNVAQISEGLSESLGIDVKAMLAGFLGGKIADKN